MNVEDVDRAFAVLSRADKVWLMKRFAVYGSHDSARDFGMLEARYRWRNALGLDGAPGYGEAALAQARRSDFETRNRVALGFLWLKDRDAHAHALETLTLPEGTERGLFGGVR
jgi:hypothetical protein